MGVGQRFQRGEGFGRDDEQRFGRIEPLQGLGHVGAVDVRHEAERHVAAAVMAERFVGHDRAQVGAADADVDHVADLLAGGAQPLAAADAVGEIGHFVQHGVDLGDDVFAVDQDRGAARRPQGDVEHGPAFGDVDFVAAKHGIDPLAQGRLVGQLARAGGAFRR